MERRLLEYARPLMRTARQAAEEIERQDRQMHNQGGTPMEHYEVLRGHCLARGRDVYPGDRVAVPKDLTPLQALIGVSRGKLRVISPPSPVNRDPSPQHADPAEVSTRETSAVPPNAPHTPAAGTPPDADPAGKTPAPDKQHKKTRGRGKAAK